MFTTINHAAHSTTNLIPTKIAVFAVLTPAKPDTNTLGPKKNAFGSGNNLVRQVTTGILTLVDANETKPHAVTDTFGIHALKNVA